MSHDPKTWWEKHGDKVILGTIGAGCAATITTFIINPPDCYYPYGGDKRCKPKSDSVDAEGGDKRCKSRPKSDSVDAEADADVDMGLSEPDVWGADVFGSENVLATAANDISGADAFDAIGDGDGIIGFLFELVNGV